jgi:hypothetical protein
MTKIAIFIAIAILLLSILGIALSGRKDNALHLQTVVYDKHMFILYDGDAFAGGIVHHPDCQCLSKEDR